MVMIRPSKASLPAPTAVGGSLRVVEERQRAGVSSLPLHGHHRGRICKPTSKRILSKTTPWRAPKRSVSRPRCPLKGGVAGGSDGGRPVGEAAGGPPLPSAKEGPLDAARPTGDELAFSQLRWKSPPADRGPPGGPPKGP
ncbi:hypothetical protein cyc_04360 [Cyclospora cayetanensis]|uniref:Uncharacterized protein n=1 Tax=Cyclospora cayetanensis TaxID=88456 RepID=A0A1D3CU50_9EIME|nr:hypothetical protein cyc_04360 [Cyclospora cayetanensis]